MIIEAIGDWFKVIHDMSMRQVNAIKASKENTTILCLMETNMILSWHIMQSQIFKTSHATAITTKHVIKITSNMTCQSISHSLNKLPFASLLI